MPQIAGKNGKKEQKRTILEIQNNFSRQILSIFATKAKIGCVSAISSKLDCARLLLSLHQNTIPMTTAIVILNWNGKPFLEKFLPSLIENSYLPNVTIVVADNGSTDGSQEWVKSNHPAVKLIEFEKNNGYTGGYNKALALIEADYFLLLNSDIEVSTDWLPPLIEAMDNDPRIGICMPKIRSFNDKEYFEYAGACGGFIDRFGYPFCRGRILSHIEKDEGQYNQPCEIFWASGAAFMIRSSLFRQMGGFDDLFFAHMEEIDLCWRAKCNGWKVCVVPQSTVYHVGGGTLPNDSPHKLYLNYRNNLLMLYKNLPGKSLYPILLSRIFLDATSAIIFLFQRKTALFKAIWQAHCGFFKMKNKAVRNPGTTLTPSKIYQEMGGRYRGSIVFSFFFSRKKVKFSDLTKIR